MLYNIKHIVFSVVLASALLVCGCQPGQKDPYAPQIITPQRMHIETLGYSVQGRPIELVTLGHGTDKTLIIATIHGNENAGTPLMAELQSYLKRRPALLEKHTIQIVPIANPDGMALNIRENANGIDLNRNFPAANRVNNHTNGIHGLTEPESKILHDLIHRESPDRIVTLHQPLVCLDYDGPGREIAERMSRYCELPVKKLGGRPGSMGSYVGIDLSTPIITVEMYNSDSNLTSQQLWQKYGIALVAAITYPQMPYQP